MNLKDNFNLTLRYHLSFESLYRYFFDICMWKGYCGGLLKMPSQIIPYKNFFTNTNYQLLLSPIVLETLSVEHFRGHYMIRNSRRFCQPDVSDDKKILHCLHSSIHHCILLMNRLTSEVYDNLKGPCSPKRLCTLFLLFLPGSLVEYCVLIGCYFPSDNFQLREIPAMHPRWQCLMSSLIFVFLHLF